MAVLVAVGFMNLVAMVVLAVVVLVEKTWAWGPRLTRIVGVVALMLAVAVAFHPSLAAGLHKAAMSRSGMTDTRGRYQMTAAQPARACRSPADRSALPSSGSCVADLT